MGELIGYVTLEEAKAFLERRVKPLPSDDVLTRGLWTAFDKIETINVRWSGKREHGKNFPRLCDQEVFPEIKEAQIQEGFSISQGDDGHVEAIAQGISSKKISDMSITYSETALKNADSFSSNAASKILRKYRRKTY